MKPITHRNVLVPLTISISLLILILLLPTLAAFIVKANIADRLSLNITEVQITDISPWSMHGSIRLGNDRQPILTIPRFEVHYSPFRLAKGRLDKLVLHEAILHLQYKDGGIDFFGTGNENSSPPVIPLKFQQIPAIIGEINLQDCALMLHSAGYPAQKMLFEARINLPENATQERPPIDIKVDGNPSLFSLEAQSPDILAGAAIIIKPKLPSATGKTSTKDKQQALPASLKAHFGFINNELVIKGTLLLPDLQLDVAASLHKSGILNLKATAPDGTFIAPALASRLALPEGLQVRGKFLGEASFNLGQKPLQGKASLRIENGLVELKEKKIAIQGINLVLTIPDLPRLTSSPDQVLSIEEIDIGNLHFSDATLHFHLRDHRKVFIEKSHLTWCGGQVASEDLVLSTDSTALTATLSCTRLNLTDVLRQLGVDGCQGKGFLSGELPLTLSRTGIRFDNGFLYSTPGEPGDIQFSDLAILRQGLPSLENTATLDYSFDALQNFTYSWTRLHINTAGNDLLISMETEGKPAIPLPYGYRNGRIVKGTQGSGLQHPVRLKVNFHLPDSEIFRFGKNIQTIRKKM